MLLAAYEDALVQAFERIEDACHAERSAPAEQRLGAAIDALLSFFAEEPHVARMCVVEVLAAGPPGRQLRAPPRWTVSRGWMERLLERGPSPSLGPVARAGAGGRCRGGLSSGRSNAARWPTCRRSPREIAETQLK